MEGRREEDPALRSWSERMTSAVVIAIVSQQGVGGGGNANASFFAFFNQKWSKLPAWHSRARHRRGPTMESNGPNAEEQFGILLDVTITGTLSLSD